MLRFPSNRLQLGLTILVLVCLFTASLGGVQAGRANTRVRPYGKSFRISRARQENENSYPHQHAQTEKNQNADGGANRNRRGD